MKKKYVLAALTGLIASAAHAQSSVTLFGLLDEGLVYSNNMRVGAQGSTQGHSNWLVNSGNIYTSRFGLRGTEDLGGGLAAIFWLENGLNVSTGKANNGGDLFGRQAWVGLSSNQYGSVTLGRQYDFMVDFIAPTSSTGPMFGGNFAQHPYDNDNLNNDMRLNSSVKYRSIDYAGFKVGAMYAFSGDAGQFSNNSAYSLGASYANGPILLGAAYLQVNRSAGAANANANGAVSTADNDALTTGGRQQMWGLGGKYTIGPAAIGLLWTHSSTDDVNGISQGGSIATLNGNNVKFDNFEINAKYALTPALNVGAAYTYTMGHFDSATQSLSPKFNTAVLNLDYSLSKRTDLYAEAVYEHVSGGEGQSAFNAGIYNLTPSANNEQVVATVGMRHRF
ncbi:general bacterial porin, GBP family [Pararobbsia alpina]|jgi:general bacterial porin, GBP family|uniref:porin n=1 Tax=Pararobbsia alpina TaxID=621374 RepID=UPI0039A4E00E